MMIYRTYGNSRNFTFEGYGITEAEALAGFNQSLAAHAKQYGLPNDWHVGIVFPEHWQYENGVGYRDGERVTP